MAICFGERGLWYKMSFFEHSARVPMIMAVSGVLNQTSEKACSLVDILPTLLDIADADPELGMPIDGRSLWPVATTGQDTDDEAIAEYCAECAAHPIYMIRRGAMKYIHCDIDPPQLFDLKNDPEERNNLADDPAHADVMAAFKEEVENRWDSAEIKNNVIRTQSSVGRSIGQWKKAGSHLGIINLSVMHQMNMYANYMDWTVAAKERASPFS